MDFSLCTFCKIPIYIRCMILIKGSLKRKLMSYEMGFLETPQSKPPLVNRNQPKCVPM